MHFPGLLWSPKALISHLCLRTSTAGMEVGREQPLDVVHQDDEQEIKGSREGGGRGLSPAPFFCLQFE